MRSRKNWFSRLRATEGSNPPPSSGASANFQSLPVTAKYSAGSRTRWVRQSTRAVAVRALAVIGGEIFAASPAVVVHRLWWRVFDRICCRIVLMRMSIFDRIYGPEPPTPADLKRETDHERLVRAFPAMGETIERKMPCRG